MFILTDRNWITVAKSISGISFRACTNRNVVGNCAASVESAGSNTWILTFLLYTCQISRTIGINNTFRMTVRWRANISWETWAWWCFTMILTSGVYTAWVWHAGISWWPMLFQYRFWNVKCFFSNFVVCSKPIKRQCHTLYWNTSDERIASEWWSTGAYWIVLDNSTFRVRAASSRTWIDAFIVGACLTVWAFGVDYTLGPTVGWVSNVSW